MDDKMPTVLTTSVVRDAQRGESHGGVYIVDFNDGHYEQIIDWSSIDILQSVYFYSFK